MRLSYILLFILTAYPLRPHICSSHVRITAMSKVRISTLLSLPVSSPLSNKLLLVLRPSSVPEAEAVSQTDIYDT